MVQCLSYTLVNKLTDRGKPPEMRKSQSTTTHPKDIGLPRQMRDRDEGSLKVNHFPWHYSYI